MHGCVVKNSIAMIVRKWLVSQAFDKFKGAGERGSFPRF